MQATEVIGYLEYCIHSLHAHDEAIHNYLITLYAKYKREKIMQYLATQGKQFYCTLQIVLYESIFSVLHPRLPFYSLVGQDPSMVTYNIRYALKLCQEIGLMEACVQLSAMLGLWESAVDLALSVNTDLAKQTVQTISQPSAHDSELCKKLWLKIGCIQYIITRVGQKVISRFFVHVKEAKLYCTMHEGESVHSNEGLCQVSLLCVALLKYYRVLKMELPLSVSSQVKNRAVATSLH